MTNVTMEQALLHLDSSYLEEFFIADAAARPSTQKRARHRLLRLVAAALCSLFLIVAGANVLSRYDYHPFLASCGSYPGEIVAGEYYYFVPHYGVMAYSPKRGAARRVLHTYYVDEFVINEYGIYYEAGRSVYVCELESGQRRHLYTAPRTDTTHIALDRMTSSDVAVTCYNKRETTLYQVILDGRTGEIKHQTEPQNYAEVKYSDSHHTIGERSLVLYQTEPIDRIQLDPTENGVSLLPAGATVSKYSARQIGQSLWFTISYEDRPSYEYADYLVLGADGSTRIVTLPYKRYGGGDDEYLFYSTYGDGVVCVEIATGRSWTLSCSSPVDDVYDIVCDGKLLYSTAPWSEEQVVWLIVRDKDLAPTELLLVNPNIADH